MQNSFNGMFWHSMAVVAGGLVGYCFGKIQEIAAQRYQKLQEDGQFKSVASMVPGSMRRTAGLLMALAAVQLVCPMLFTNGSQWWVSGGLVAGYGLVLYNQIRARMASVR
jgi:membrane protein YqaA with SNARE-associated domain